MASLYAQYLLERTNDLILEKDYGFATYRYLQNNIVYIIDIYVTPDKRNKKLATEMADEIVKIAKEKGCVKVIGSVVPSMKGSTASIGVLMGYGMVLESAGNDVIIFGKGI